MAVKKAPELSSHEVYLGLLRRVSDIVAGARGGYAVPDEHPLPADIPTFARIVCAVSGAWSEWGRDKEGRRLDIPPTEWSQWKTPADIARWLHKRNEQP